MDIVKQQGRHQLRSIRMEIETCVRDISIFQVCRIVSTRLQKTRISRTDQITKSITNKLHGFQRGS